MSAVRATTPASTDVPAIFPFPEPIPQGAPARKAGNNSSPTPASQRPQSEQPYRPSEAASPRGGGKSHSSEAGGLESFSFGGALASPSASTSKAYVSCKYACGDGAFVEHNRRRANNWISECKPKGMVFDCEKAAWFRHKMERTQNQEFRNHLLRKMQPLPFEDWYQQQIADEAYDAEEAPEKRCTVLNKIGQCLRTCTTRASTSSQKAPSGSRRSGPDRRGSSAANA